MKKTIFLILIGFTLGAFRYTDDLIARISQNLDQLKKSNLDENVCVLLNQTKYSVRDTIFFNAYYSTSDLQPIKSKRIFSMLLASETGRAVSKINFAIQNGQTSNHITIPESIKPGFFKLVVFDSQNGKTMFSKNLVVVDRKNVTISRKTNNAIRFNFEGGHFISAVSNHLVIQGDPNQTIQIINSTNETVLSVSTDSTGVGSGWLTPKYNESYKLSSQGKVTELPKAALQGCTISIDPKEDRKEIKVTVATESPQAKKENFILLVHNQKIVSSAAIAFNQRGEFSYFIDNSDFPNGLTQIVVLNESAVVGERMYYDFKQKVNAVIKLGKNKFLAGEVVESELQVRDVAGNPLPAVFSVSVNPLQADLWPTKIHEEFWLNPLLANFSYPLPVEHKRRMELINNLLVLENWHPINWNDLLANKLPSINTTNRILFSGSVKSTRDSNTPPDSTLVNCFLQNSMIGYEGRVKNGKILVPILFDFYGKEEVFYSMEFKNKELDNSYVIELDSVAPKTETTIYSSETQDLDQYGDQSHKRNLVMESYHFFGANSKNTTDYQNLNDRFEDEANGSDLQVKVDDYVVFPTMVDLVKEIIPFLEIKVRKNSRTVRLLINQKKFFSRPKIGPLYIIDGSMTKDQEIFLNLKPIDIFSIKIINDANKLTPFGSLGRNGIVLVQTKRKKNEKIVLETKTLPLLGLNKAKSSISENYNAQKTNSRIPDVRSNLFWAPQIETSSLGEATLKFICSNLAGSTVIVLKGKTKTGVPFETSAIFSVE